MSKVRNEHAAKMAAALGENDTNIGDLRFIHTGYEPLNYAMTGRYDGGLPQARVIEVAGESSTGKTALCVQWMIETQQQGGAVGFIDWERSLSVGLAEEQGLNTEMPYWFYRKPKTWEEGNVQMKQFMMYIRDNNVIPPEAPILLIADSIAMSIPKSVLEKEMTEHSMNDTTALARVTSTGMKHTAAVCDQYNATVIYINQLREKPGVTYGDPRYTPGGKAPIFVPSVRLMLSREVVKDKTTKEILSQFIKVDVVKSKLTAPFKKCEIQMTFDEHGRPHFDYTLSLIEHLVKMNLLPAAGARVTWLDGKSYFRKGLAEKIDAENLYAQLKALLPSKDVPKTEATELIAA
ncbi:hypothetical protein ACODYM_28705 [Burkholderia gladioli]|uniref:hypothetical protein n=1 Tax=Burkholderia gladioli TaxID=28095 RepID=UPI003B504B08